MKTIIFAGPSLTPEALQIIEKEEIELKPPIYRGSIEAIIENGFKGNIIIVDGRFKELLAVGHAEIREGLRKGCCIYGLSSMGAIRAYEMESLGMIGYGKVFEYFKKEDDFQDDEVALLHAEHPFYYSISEPLVHFRECIKDSTMRNRISKEIGNQIIKELKELYFGKRTMTLFIELINKYTNLNTKILKQEFHKFKIKDIDLLKFLQAGVWKS